MSTLLVVLIGKLLKKPSPEIAYACDGQEALQAMHDRRPNLVVTDLMMPNMDGLELVAAIAKTYPFIPVILTTGMGNDRIAIEALDAGASGYVPKNKLQDWLFDSVENLLAIALDENAQDSMMECPIGCQFSIDNDPTKIHALINNLRRFIRRSNLCDENGVIRTCVALEEALNNALYHGNLELDSRLRECDRKEFRALVEERRSSHPYRNRRIHVTVRVESDHATIVVRDEGHGFDATNLPDPTDPMNLERLSGRGLLLMRTFMDEVRYNDVGNEVTLVKRKQPASPGRDSEACERQT